MDEKHKKNFPLIKENILRERKDFRQVFSSGRKQENRYFQIIYAYRDFDSKRIAVVLSRKFGKAHVRNKMRRRIKEIYRLDTDIFPSHTDCIIRPREAAKHLSFPGLKNNLVLLLKECKR